MFLLMERPSLTTLVSALPSLPLNSLSPRVLSLPYAPTWDVLRMAQRTNSALDHVLIVWENFLDNLSPLLLTALVKKLQRLFLEPKREMLSCLRTPVSTKRKPKTNQNS